MLGGEKAKTQRDRQKWRQRERQEETEDLTRPRRPGGRHGVDGGAGRALSELGGGEKKRDSGQRPEGEMRGRRERERDERKRD